MTHQFEKIKSVELIKNTTPDYVYDLEIDGTNTFFANDILVHNSAFFLCTPIVEEFCRKTNKTIQSLTKTDIRAIIKQIDAFIKDEINPFCQNIVKEKCKSSEPERIEFKREAFSLQCAAFAKKKYFLRILDKEGISTDEFKYTGIEIKKNELPPNVKVLIKKIYEDSCRKFWTEFEYIDKLRGIWKMFLKMDYDEISFYKGYNTERFSSGFLRMKTGTTLVAKAATYYNQLIEQFGLNDRHSLIRVGDKLRVCYVMPNKYAIEVIAFPNKFPKELREYLSIDYYTMFQKMILKPLDSFCSLRKWKQFDPTNEPKNDIFGL